MAPEIVPATNNFATGLAKVPNSPSHAYVTFLAGGDGVEAVEGLAKGLMKVKSAYPLVVAVLPYVQEEHRRKLVNQGCIVREIEPVYPPENRNAMAYYEINYSKLGIWKFVEYSRMTYLDGGIKVFGNIDDLFEKPDGYFYAVMDCFCEKTWNHTPQYEIGYCQQTPDKVQWPEALGPKPPLYFNAGMFVFEPNLSTYDDLLKTLKITLPTPFAEQDFLNMYFKDIYKPIPNIYNLMLAMLWRHPENVELNKVRVVHCRSKPCCGACKLENMESVMSTNNHPRPNTNAPEEAQPSVRRRTMGVRKPTRFLADYGNKAERDQVPKEAQLSVRRSKRDRKPTRALADYVLY